MTAIDDLAERFSRFADRECGESPLYRALANCVAADLALLDIAALACHGPVPNLFLAAIHDLLMQGRGPELGAYYQTIVGHDARPPAGAPDALRAFMRSEPEALEPALRERLVQTNEVRRAAMVQLALNWLQDHFDLGEFALIEVGTSAGLLLATDRYEYRFGTARIDPADEPGLIIETELRGGRPPVGRQPPEIVERIGIDLVTLDMADEADRRWLRALIWGDQPERLASLETAIAIARQTPMTLRAGDANMVLPNVLADLPPRLPAVVFHSHALNQFSPAARERFDQILSAASPGRPVFRIAMEGWSPRPYPTCTVSVYRAGTRMTSSDLAHYDAHGAWIEWLV